MDAILTAGGKPAPGEPLYPYTQGNLKAMLDVAGKPMIQWPLDALSGSSYIDRVVITGMNATDKLQALKKCCGANPKTNRSWRCHRMCPA